MLVRFGPVTGDLVDAYPIKDWLGRVRLSPMGRRNIGRLPPNGSLFQQVVSVVANRSVHRQVRQFMITSEDDHAAPLRGANNFIYFHADKRIGAHPLDLLTQRREAVDMIFVGGEIDRNNIWLTRPRTAESADSSLLQEFKTLSRRHLLDYHRRTRHNFTLLWRS